MTDFSDYFTKSKPAFKPPPCERCTGAEQLLVFNGVEAPWSEAWVQLAEELAEDGITPIRLDEVAEVIDCDCADTEA